MDKGDTAFGQSFIVLSEATIEAKASEGAFHHPTTGQYGETLLLLRAQDRLKAKAKTLRNPSLQRAAIGAVNPDETQFPAETAASSEQLPCPIAVRQVGSSDQDGQCESQRIDEKMPFPSRDAFAAIVASHTCRCMASLDCLTVDTASRWMLVSPDSMTNPHSERVMQPAPGTIVPPLPEVGVNALPRRKVTRQHPPLDATHSQVENGINHQTHIQAAGSPARSGCGNQMLDNRPLAVSQICWVSFCFHKNYVSHNLADSLYFSNNLSVHNPSPAIPRIHPNPANPDSDNKKSYLSSTQPFTKN